MCQVLGRGDAVEYDRLVAGEGREEIDHRSIASIDQKSMVPGVDKHPADNLLDQREIHHHTVGRIPGLVDHFAGQRNLERIAVAVQMTALALMIRNTVARIKLEAAGNLHGKDRDKNGVGLYHCRMLTPEDHRRDRAGMTYVYPVVSRRAGGVSIGINLNTNNACNWACIYCQVDNLKRGSPPPVDLDLLRLELKGFLAEAIDGDWMAHHVPVSDRRLVDIAFSGNGEPTCAAEFEQCVAIAGEVLLERALLPQILLRLITNGSQFHRPSVQRGVALLGEHGGEVWFKLDRVGTEATRVINGVALPPEKVLAGLRQSIPLARTWVQTCWFGLDGTAPTSDERSEYCHLLAEVADGIAGVHLYGLARPSMQSGATRLSRLPHSELEDFAAEIQKKTGVRVIITP